MKRKLFTWHSYFGLVAGLFLTIISLSGSLLVFHHEIDEVFALDDIQVKPVPGKVSFDNSYKQVIKLFPAREIRIYTEHLSADSPLKFDIRGENRRQLFTHPVNGEILWNTESDKVPSRWLLKLHYTLFSGLTGNIVIALVGFCLLGSIITGLFVFGNQISKALTFRLRVKFKNWRQSSSVLHRYVGIWSLVLNLILVITGLILQIKIISSGLSSGQQTEYAYPAVEASLDFMQDQLHRHFPDFSTYFIRLPHQAGDPVIFYGHLDADFMLYAPYANTITFDAQSGALLDSTFICDMNAGSKLYSMVTPLHFGDFGGLMSKIIYCVVGLSPGVLSLTGFLLWYRKKRKNPPKVVLSEWKKRKLARAGIIL